MPKLTEEEKAQLQVIKETLNVVCVCGHIRKVHHRHGDCALCPCQVFLGDVAQGNEAPALVVGDLVDCADHPISNVRRDFGFGNGQAFHVTARVLEIQDDHAVIELLDSCGRCTACNHFRIRCLPVSRLKSMVGGVPDPYG